MTVSSSESPPAGPQAASRKDSRKKSRRQQGGGGRVVPAPREGDPLRRAILRAYMAVEGGADLAQTPPPALRGEAERRRFTRWLRGMVRHRRRLRAELAHLARGGLDGVQPRVAALALLGLYALRFEETPPHAVLYETVALAPGEGVGRAKGWINGVLRAATRLDLPAFEAGLSLGEATSHPDWMIGRWERQYGAARTAEICRANNQYGGSTLRVETRRITPAALCERLAAEGIEAEIHPLWPTALRVENLGPLLRSPSFSEGLCYVQDLSSQVACAWLAPALGGRLLEPCAAPGGKLTWLRGRAGEGTPAAWQAGADLDGRRLARVRENLRRLRLPETALLQADGRRLPFADGGPGRGWDAVLLDAPCSATGMIRKYPEMKWRKQPEQLSPLVEMQAALLDESLRVLRPGGHLAYITCSLEGEENGGQVAALLERQPTLRQVSLDTLPLPEGAHPSLREALTADGAMLLFPGKGHMGLYAALLRKHPGADPAA